MQREMQPFIYRFRFGEFEVATIMDSTGGGYRWVPVCYQLNP
jgi:hypothetical protein